MSTTRNPVFEFLCEHADLLAALGERLPDGWVRDILRAQAKRSRDYATIASIQATIKPQGEPFVSDSAPALPSVRSGKVRPKKKPTRRG